MVFNFKPNRKCASSLSIGKSMEYVARAFVSCGEASFVSEEENLWMKNDYCAVCAQSDNDMMVEFYLDKIQEGRIMVEQDILGDSHDRIMDLTEFVKKLPSEMDIENFNGGSPCVNVHIECMEGVLAIWTQETKKRQWKTLEEYTGPERLWEVQIGDIMCINAHKEIFLDVLKKLEYKKIKYNLGVMDIMISGHCIDVPCTYVRTEDFQIVFADSAMLFVEFGKEIAQDSAFITTKGNKHSIGDILRRNTDRESSFVKIEGYGADDAWHYIHNHEADRVYSLGYSL